MNIRQSIPLNTRIRSVKIFGDSLNQPDSALIGCELRLPQIGIRESNGMHHLVGDDPVVVRCAVRIYSMRRSCGEKILLADAQGDGVGVGSGPGCLRQRPSQRGEQFDFQFFPPAVKAVIIKDSLCGAFEPIGRKTVEDGIVRIRQNRVATDELHRGTVERSNRVADRGGELFTEQSDRVGAVDGDGARSAIL